MSLTCQAFLISLVVCSLSSAKSDVIQTGVNLQTLSYYKESGTGNHKQGALIPFKGHGTLKSTLDPRLTSSSDHDNTGHVGQNAILEKIDERVAKNGEIHAGTFNPITIPNEKDVFSVEIWNSADKKRVQLAGSSSSVKDGFAAKMFGSNTLEARNSYSRTLGTRRGQSSFGGNSRSFLAPIVPHGAESESIVRESESDVSSDVRHEVDKRAAESEMVRQAEEEVGAAMRAFVEGLLVPGIKTVIAKVLDRAGTGTGFSAGQADIANAAQEAMEEVCDEIITTLTEKNSNYLNKIVSESDSVTNQEALKKSPLVSNEERQEPDDMLLDLTPIGDKTKVNIVESKVYDRTVRGIDGSDGRNAATQNMGAEPSLDDGARKDAAGSFFDEHLAPEIKKEATILEAMGKFFSNGKIVEHLTEPLKRVVAKMKGFGGSSDSDKTKLIGKNETSQGSKPDTSENVNKPWRHSGNNDYLQWFVSSVVIPNLRETVKELDDLPTPLTSSSEPQALLETSAMGSSRFLAAILKSVQAREGMGRGGSVVHPSGMENPSGGLVSDIQNEAQELKYMTSSISTEQGQAAIADSVKTFVKGLFRPRKHGHDKSGYQKEPKNSSSWKQPTPKLRRKTFPLDIDIQDPSEDFWSQDLLTVPDKGSSSEYLIDDFVNQLLVPSLESKSEILLDIAEKISNPNSLKAVRDLIQQKIVTVLEKRSDIISGKKSPTNSDTKPPTESEMATERGESSNSNDLFKNSQFANRKGENIVMEIVKLKVKIAKDRRLIGELEQQINGAESLDEKLNLIEQKIVLVKTITESSEAMKKLFVELREGDTAGERRKQNDQQGKHGEGEVGDVKGEQKQADRKGNTGTHLEKMKSLIKKISKMEKLMKGYRKQISRMTTDIAMEVILPEKMKLVDKKLNLVKLLRDGGLKINQLYDQLREAEADVDRDAETESEGHDGFEMQFTESEKMKYARLLGDLSLAEVQHDTSAGEDDESNVTTVIGWCIASVAIVTVAVVIVALLYRSRHGRYRMYRHVGREETIDSRQSLITAKDRYGSC